jgi:hypothetical protein
MIWFNGLPFSLASETALATSFLSADSLYAKFRPFR